MFGLNAYKESFLRIAQTAILPTQQSPYLITVLILATQDAST